MGKTRFQKLVKAYTQSFGDDREEDDIDPNNMVAKIYNNNKPRIFLETLTARSTTIVLAITYVSFILGFAIDVSSVYQGFTTGIHEMSGLTTSSNGWTGTVTGLSNVISFSLEVHQSNFSTIHMNQLEEVKIRFDAVVYCCYQTDGCHGNFGNTKSPNSWQRVLTIRDSTESFPVNMFLDKDNGIHWEIIPSTFQNQESLPSNGKVRSYYIQLNYTSNPLRLFTTLDPVDAGLITYTANVVQQPSSRFTTGSGSVILLVVTIVTLISFVAVMLKQRKKWWV